MKQILYILVVALAVATAGCINDTGTNGTTNTTSGSGKVVYAITDAAANMGTVSSIDVTISGVSMHRASATSEAEAWVDVSTGAKAFDLLKLKANNTLALLAEADVPAGNYNQIRFKIDSVVVTDANGSFNAKVPSNELKMNADVVVNNQSEASVVLDFIADQSLHVTSTGNAQANASNKYILAPVIKLETRTNADVNIRNGVVVITGGSVRTNAEVGMDVNGNVGVGLKIPATANLTTDVTGKINLGGGLGASLSPVLRTIEADDSGFYPSSIEVPKGSQVTITFKTRNQNVYFGGLRYDSPAWGKTKNVKPGEMVDVTFTANEDVTYQSFWPNTNDLKATGKVVVV